MRKRHRLIVAGPLLIAIALAALASPAAACGCGAYIPRGGSASVVLERSLIRWDGHTEDIFMELSVQGSSEEAAWILPVPTRATVELGDRELFGALEYLTRPRLAWRYWLFPILLLPLAIALLLRLRRRGRIWLGGLAIALLVTQLGGCGGAAGPVTLLQRQTLGPFEVSNLAATDANALGNWLTTNGYSFPPELAAVLRPYVDQHWYFVAIRLAPGGGGQSLGGLLDPLHVTFASDKIVYPMRASALARTAQQVQLYVLADHRIEPTSAFGNVAITFADWIEPAMLNQSSPLASVVKQRLFLTAFTDTIANPAQIKDDYQFAVAAQDAIFYRPTHNELDLVVGLLIVLAVLFVLTTATPKGPRATPA